MSVSAWLGGAREGEYGGDCQQANPRPDLGCNAAQTILRHRRKKIQILVSLIRPFKAVKQPSSIIARQYFSIDHQWTSAADRLRPAGRTEQSSSLQSLAAAAVVAVTDNQQSLETLNSFNLYERICEWSPTTRQHFLFFSSFSLWAFPTNLVPEIRGFYRGFYASLSKIYSRWSRDLLNILTHFSVSDVE